MAEHPENPALATIETLLTVADVADILCISKRQVYNAAASGKIPRPYKIGHRTARWKASEIQAHIDGLRTAN